MVLYLEPGEPDGVFTQMAAVVHTERDHRHGMLHIQVDLIAGIVRIQIIGVVLRTDRRLAFGTPVIHVATSFRRVEIQVVLLRCHGQACF